MSELTPGQAATNGLKLVAETVIVPGSSLILDGNLKSGAGHAVVGLVAKALIGPVGWLLVAANSFSSSVTEKPLLGHFKKDET